MTTILLAALGVIACWAIMGLTHVVTKSLMVRGEMWNDTGGTRTGDTEIGTESVVNAYGGGANGLVFEFPATGFQSLCILSTVPCVVTFSSVSTIDGVAGETVTLAAGAMRQVLAIGAACTAVSVGANTDVDGLAGTIKISALYNA